MVNYQQIIEDLKAERDRTLCQLEIWQKLAAIDGQIQLLEKLVEIERQEAKKEQGEKKQDEQPAKE